jgi:hypothetical protein
MDREGMLLLLDITDTKLKEKKAIVRAFIISHYHEFLISSSEKSLTVVTQGYVPGRTRRLCHRVPSYKVKTTLWPGCIFQWMLT